MTLFIDWLIDFRLFINSICFYHQIMRVLIKPNWGSWRHCLRTDFLQVFLRYSSVLVFTKRPLPETGTKWRRQIRQQNLLDTIFIICLHVRSKEIEPIKLNWRWQQRLKFRQLFPSREKWKDTALKPASRLNTCQDSSTY